MNKSLLKELVSWARIRTFWKCLCAVGHLLNLVWICFLWHAGVMDLWTDWRRANQHRSFPSKLWGKLPYQIPSSRACPFYIRPAHFGQPVHSDQRCEDDRRGTIYLWIRHLPFRQRTRSLFADHAGWVCLFVQKKRNFKTCKNLKINSGNCIFYYIRFNQKKGIFKIWLIEKFKRNNCLSFLSFFFFFNKIRGRICIFCF